MNTFPTQGPMDSFNAPTRHACHVEWWFADGAPGLERDRAMLYDLKEYVASCQSRFNNTEMIMVMHNMVRRLKLLKGTRAAIGRKGSCAQRSNNP